jgi:hypothetical protein
MAPVVAMMTWLISAPPAGGVLAASALGAATRLATSALIARVALWAVLDMGRSSGRFLPLDI